MTEDKSKIQKIDVSQKIEITKQSDSGRVKFRIGDDSTLGQRSFATLEIFNHLMKDYNINLAQAIKVGYKLKAIFQQKDGKFKLACIFCRDFNESGNILSLINEDKKEIMAGFVCDPCLERLGFDKMNQEQFLTEMEPILKKTLTIEKSTIKTDCHPSEADVNEAALMVFEIDLNIFNLPEKELPPTKEGDSQ
jgi:hypothetical protein